MRRFFVILTVCLCAVSTAIAADSLSAASKLTLSSKRAASGLFKGTRPIRYQAFVVLENGADAGSLSSHGIIVQATYGRYVTASVPANRLGDMLHVPGVMHVSLEQPVTLCNDSARALSRVDAVQMGDWFASELTGCGVIVGMIDVGFDFNHINLCDHNGRTRVRAVYMPDDTTGVAPIVDGCELPGSSYETPESIGALTTDYTGSSHGTHTTGTAAGGYVLNGWHGVAPEAEIVACGMAPESLTDVNIANCVKYVFDYADRVGKPCVINMSISSNSGPNDGTSFLSNSFATLSGPGRICVLSAGNDGNVPICFHHTIEGANDTVTTLLRGPSGALRRNGYVSMWSDMAQPHQSRVVIINRQSQTIEYASPVVSMIGADSVYVISSESDTLFARYCSGQLEFASAIEPVCDADGGVGPQERFHSYWIMDVEPVDDQYLLGLQYMSGQETRLAGWSTSGSYFYTFGLPGVVGGSKSGSISDLATGDDVISVGAYCSRSSYVDRNGDLVTFYDSRPTAIAGFSSYGPDERGVTKPDICAPGLALISSANRFNNTSDRTRWPEPVVVDGIEYPYYSNKGTSMSAPVVTGAIALMLQVNPRLTAADVRTVLSRSAYQDEYVVYGDAERWGCGKLDVQAAISEVLSSTLASGDVNHDGEVNIVDVMAIVKIILGQADDADQGLAVRADVDHDRQITITDVNRVINLILNNE